MMNRPPDVQMAACEAAICGEASAVGCGTRIDYPLPRPAAQPVLTFGDVVARATPAELLAMARLHRRYMPQEHLPQALQRAIGRAWAMGGAR